MNANKIANVCFYDSGNNEMKGNKTPHEKRLDDSAAFAFLGPLSVASKSVTCQGKTHRDVRFSMDKPGWRIHAALKQDTLFEGSPGAFPGPTRPGCIFLVTSFVQAKEVTRRSGETGNYRVRKDNKKQMPTDFGAISGLDFWLLYT